MLKKSGYVQRNRYEVTDSEGSPCWIIEFNIGGKRFGIRVGELRRALSGPLPARVEHLRQNWGQHLTGLAGRAILSKSKKALNLEMNSGEYYTISVKGLKTVLVNPRFYATISQITNDNPRKKSYKKPSHLQTTDGRIVSRNFGQGK